MEIDGAEWRPGRASVVAWVLYDLANTTFALGVGSRYFGLWLIEQHGGADWWIGVTTAVAMLFVIVLGPWIGALTDHVGRRRPYLTGATLVCVTATALLATGDVAASLVLYVVGTAAFHLGTVVYDALLPEVSTTDDRGRVSGVGVAVGYLGSALALTIGTYVLPRAGYAGVFRALAAAFLLFALPAFFLIRERPRVRRAGAAPSLAASPLLMVSAWREAAAYPGMVRFLIGRFLYTDAINTVFLFSAVYARMELGYSDADTSVLAMAGVVAAGVGATVAGRLVDRIGPRRVLHGAVYTMLGGLAAAVLARLLAQPALGWMVGLAGGGGLGAVWTADRVYLTRLSPPERLGESFGLYASVGRFATVAGPLIWALVADGLGWGRAAALGALMLLLVASRVVLGGVIEPVGSAIRADEGARTPDERPEPWS